MILCARALEVLWGHHVWGVYRDLMDGNGRGAYVHGLCVAATKKVLQFSVHATPLFATYDSVVEIGTFGMSNRSPMGQAGSRAFLAFRLMLYVLVTAMVSRGILLLVKHYGADWVFREDAPVEWTEAGLLTTSSLLIFFAAQRFARVRQVGIVLGSLLVMAVVRELDGFWENHIFHRDAWGYIDLVLLLALLVYAVPRFHTIKEQAFVLTHSRVFGFLWCGFLVIMGFSRFMGTKGVWHIMLDPNYQRGPGRLMEESTELLGYLIILFGAIELHYEKPIETTPNT